MCTTVVLTKDRYNQKFYSYVQLVATGIEDDCILKTCSQRKSTFPKAFAKLQKSFPRAFQELFVWYKTASANFLSRNLRSLFCTRQKAPGKLF